MARRKERPIEEFPPAYREQTRHEGVQIRGRWLRVGGEFTVRGEGRFRFTEYVESPKGNWVTGVGGKKDERSFRSFSLDRVRAVHVKEKLR